MQLCFPEDSINDLAKRVEQLEKQQKEMILLNSEDGPHALSFLKDNLTFGGFFESSENVLQGPDTQFQATNVSNLLGFNFAAEFTNDLRFVSQLLTGLTIPLLNPDNDPRATTRNQPRKREYSGFNFGAIPTQGYLDYTINDHTNIEAGFGYVPFGYAAQQRELVLFVRRGGPQILRTTELFSPLWSGFHLYQRYDADKSALGYNLYSFTKLEDPKIPGLGARAWWSFDEEAVVAGLSLQTAKYNGKFEEILGGDARFQSSFLVITTEYARRFSKNNEDPWSIYLEPGYFINDEKILLYTFIDYAQSPFSKTAGSLEDPHNKFEYGLGVNWLPTSYTRLRFGLSYNYYVHNGAVIMGQNRDFANLDLSAGVAF